jgi:hypothetical protein
LDARLAEASGDTAVAAVRKFLDDTKKMNIRVTTA